MVRHDCHTCDVLKEIYWLKATRFVVAARTARPSGRNPNEAEVQALEDDAMDALRTLLRHINACYGFTLDRVA